MALSVGVHDGGRYVLAGAGVVHSWANCREGGSEVVEGPCKCGAHVSDGDGDEFHPPPVFLEGRDEGLVLPGFYCLFLVASEVFGEPILNENEGAKLLIEVGGSRV